MELYFPLILDGANGTELQKRGYDGSKCTEAWVLEHPEVMKKLQEEYVEAGSDIVYAPTFGANRVKLEENGYFNMVPEFTQKLVTISKEAAAGKALVAGDIATSGKFIAPLGDVSFADLYDMYREQAEAMEEAGVDLYAIETIMTVPDARAALLAVKDVSDKPVIVSFTCDENGRTLTGSDVRAALVIMQGMGIDVFGLNCSTGPKEMLEQAKRLRGLAEVPLAIKPNAGLPKTINGETVYDCPPDEFVSLTKEFTELGAGLFGGCCGTGPEHIAKIAPQLEDFEFRKPEPQYRDKVVCATEKDVFILEPGIKAGEVIECGPDLEEQIRKANKSGSQIITIRISCEPDIDEFEAAQYAIRKPLCIVCDDAKLLDEALMLYQGRAMYAGSLSDEELAPLVRRYGLII